MPSSWNGISWWHVDVIRWNHLPRYWPFVRGNHHRWFPSQRSVTRTFDVFSDLRLSKRWINSRDAGDLRRHRAHYDVNVIDWLVLSLMLLSNYYIVVDFVVIVAMFLYIIIWKSRQKLVKWSSRYGRYFPCLYVCLIFPIMYLIRNNRWLQSYSGYILSYYR